MNWKLIFGLSLLGLVMGIATVFVIPTKIEPAFWLLIFVISAVLIARNCVSRHFLHGLMLGIVNGVWVTAAHVLLYQQYTVRHAAEMAQMQAGPLGNSPRLMMTIFGMVIGVVSGLVLGLFAFIAGRFLKPGQKDAALVS